MTSKYDYFHRILKLTSKLLDLNIIFGVYDLLDALDLGHGGGGDALLGHDGAVVAVGLQQLPRVVLDEGGGEAREEGTRHVG